MLQGKQNLYENRGTFLVGSVGIKCTFSSMISMGNCFNERLAMGVDF